MIANGSASPAEYAESYLNSGLSIIAVRGDGTKAPAVPSWKQYQNERASLEEAGRWFMFDNIGIAIIHGEVSGNSELIDIDNADVFEPYCEEVERVASGLIDKLTIIKTPRPGFHLVYRCDEVEGNQKLATDADGKALIETRGQGGYALAPGSPPECHETGRTYDHHSGPPLTELPTITPGERAILFRVAASFTEIVEEDYTEPRRSTAFNGGVSPGDDLSQRAQWDEIITPHGWTLDHDSGDKSYWRRPGKTTGWSATTGCKSKSGNDLLCVFSSNAHPLEGTNGKSQCSSYSKFAAYAVLNHGGDYSEAAKQLAKDGYGDQSKKHEHKDRVDEEDRYRAKQIEKFSLGKLIQDYPDIAPPVVDGLLREGETANLISVSKVGKSWLAYNLAISIATGVPWLDKFGTTKGKVLLIDNELHKSTLAGRIPKVGKAMGFYVENYADNIDVWPLRGNLRSLQELGSEFDQIEPGHYQAIIFDAKYRFAVEGVSENDNAAETQVYNLLDRFSGKLNTAILLVHHSSKGNQSGKRVTDVGSGAGAQSRAADCHLVLREHEEDGLMVLDAAVRSFPPVEPMTLKWDFPLWVPTDEDPSQLSGLKTKGQERQKRDDQEGVALIIKALLKGPSTARALRETTPLGKDRLQRLLDGMVYREEIGVEEIVIKNNKCKEYRLPKTEE